jgi:hypothetical protein
VPADVLAFFRPVCADAIHQFSRCAVNLGGAQLPQRFCMAITNIDDPARVQKQALFTLLVE